MRPASILLAEDEEHIARLVAFKLGKHGHTVTLARDGREAMARLDGGPWDLIILDVMMPHHDGWEVLRRVRASASCARVPVLMLTAKNLGGDLAGAAELGATRVLSKPFDPAELARVVEELAR